MLYSLTIPASDLERLMPVVAETKESLHFFPAGLRSAPGEQEWLLRSTRPVANGPGAGPLIALYLSEREIPPSALMADLELLPARVEVLLVMGDGRLSGTIVGIARLPDGSACRGIDRIHLPGSGMATWRLDGSKSPAATPEERETYQRWIALHGIEAWLTLSNLRIAIVGCGGMGSILAWSLSASGVRFLDLIDGDVLLPHNVPRMALVGYDDAAAGLPKPVAIVERLQAVHHRDGAPIAHAVEAAGAVPVLAAADLIIVTVDSHSALFFCASVAARYKRVLLVANTGVFPDRRGFDVRIALPPDCLCHLGGADGGAALAELLGGRRERPESAASLLSLNLRAAAHALEMIEDLVTGKLRHSKWIHLQGDGFSGSRVLETTSHAESRPRSQCAICRMRGAGDLRQ